MIRWCLPPILGFFAASCAFAEVPIPATDAMPHVHWTEPDLPEADEALDLQAAFLAQHTRS
jgi:hypothetical protein